MTKEFRIERHGGFGLGVDVWTGRWNKMYRAVIVTIALTFWDVVVKVEW